MPKGTVFEPCLKGCGLFTMLALGCHFLMKTFYGISIITNIFGKPATSVIFKLPIRKQQELIKMKI